MAGPLKIVLLGDMVVANLHRLQAKADFPYEAVCVPGAMPAPERDAVCNAFGHVRAAAEYALMTMLMWTHRWKEVEDSFRGGSWAWSGSAGGPFRHELNSKVVGVVGLGHMSRELCDRIAAMGVRVLGCGRTRPGDLRTLTIAG